MLFDPIIRMFWEGSHRRGWCEPWRLIYDCQLVYVSEGMCQLNLAGRVAELSAGWLALIPPALPHETAVPRRARRHCIHFDWLREYAGLSSPLQVNDRRQYQVELEHRVPPQLRKLLPLHLATDALTRRLIEALLEGLRTGSDDTPYRLWPLLRRIIDLSGNTSVGAGEPTAEAVLRVKDLIESDYARDLGYAEFCRLTRLSRCHLCSIFSRSLGMPPVAYLNHVRLAQAARLLVGGDLNIAETARTCGIADANYFARIFKRKFSLSPEQFRTHARKRSP